MKTEHVPPMPLVGDRIKQIVEGKPDNPNNWMRFAEVRGIVDEHLVLCRWMPVKLYHLYSLLSPLEWELRWQWFTVVRGRKIIQRAGPKLV